MRAVVLIATTFALLFGVTTFAHATDCKRAKTQIEQMICGDETLKAADSEMNAAYVKLLTSTKDRKIRALVTASQKRWLKAREARDFELDDGELHPAPVGKETTATSDNKKLALNDIRQRLLALSGTQTSGAQPFLVMQVNAQRNAASRYSGGRFAGYNTTCWFLPPRLRGGHYECIAKETFQHGNRVCSVDTEWASGHETQRFSVSVIVGKKLRTIATCQSGHSPEDTLCPDTNLGEAERKAAGWNMKPVAPSDPAERTERSRLPTQKYDPDVRSILGNQPWLHACLTDKGFPPMSMGVQNR